MLSVFSLNHSVSRAAFSSPKPLQIAALFKIQEIPPSVKLWRHVVKIKKSGSRNFSTTNGKELLQGKPRRSNFYMQMILSPTMKPCLCTLGVNELASEEVLPA
jgi:hypothetical protein